MIDKQSVIDRRVASCHGMLRIAGGPMALAMGGVGADGAWSGSGHPHQNTWAPSPSAGERVSESQAGHRDNTAHAGARARGGKPEPPVLLCGAPAGSRPHSPQQAEGGEQLRPFARRGSGGSHSPSPLGASLDGRRLHVRNVFAGICHHLLTSLTPTPPFFSPLTATRPEGSMRVGAMGKWGLGVFLLQFFGKKYLVLIFLLQSLDLGKKLLPAAGKARQERDGISHSIPHCSPRGVNLVLGTSNHLWALEAA